MLPKYLLLLCLIPFYARAQKLEGTYRDVLKIDVEKPYHLINIHRTPSGEYLFYLEAGRGAPSYNSGAKYGKLTRNKITGNYEYLPIGADDCKLVLIHKGNTIVIKTATGECGFGNGVYADCKYKLADARNPAYFISQKARKVYFNRTPPDKYIE